MRRIFFLALIAFVGMTATTVAQTTGRHKAAKQQTAKNKSTSRDKVEQSAKADTTTLTSATANQAYGNAPNRFSISDPTINLLNERASGSNVPVSGSGIVGMPKGSYGFANGKILLRPSTALSSGTVNGSGAVGTGTTIMGVGTDQNTPGINGKNPYAGPWLWGTKPAVQQVPARDNNRKQ